MGGSTKKLPFENETENRFGYESQDPNNPWVQRILAQQFETDPGVERRTQLAQQASRNRWNSAFLGDVPDFVRMKNMQAEQRGIAQEGAADMRAAQFQKQGLEFARNSAFMPQLVQRGGKSSGFQSQYSPGLFGQVLSSFAGGLGGGLGGRPF